MSVNEGKGYKVIHDTGEVVFYGKHDVDLIVEPTKGSDTTLNGDKLNLTASNPLFLGFGKKNQGTNSWFHGVRRHELNNRGMIKDLYVDNPKKIVINDL